MHALAPRIRLAAPQATRSTRSTAWRLASRTVVMLGVTSMLTDVSSEMVSTILPLYFLMYLHLSPLQFGMLDGVYRGASAVVQLGASVIADRWQRYKEVAGLGYGLSALARIGLLLVGAAPVPLAGLVFADRTGKGIRTAPRDALISLTSRPGVLGQAFGVHRTLDTLGSMLGPLVAFALLASVPGRFDVIFVVSLGFAIVGLAALVLLVDNPSRSVVRRKAAASLPRALGLLRMPQFRRLVLAGACLSVFTISDAFVFLALQHEADVPMSMFPLLYTGTSVLFLALALPVGRLADRVGRERVFVGGYALLGGCVAVLLVPMPGLLRVVLALALLGGFYASTDGVLMALASSFLPRDLRSSGLALLTTGTSVGLLLSSPLFGGLWTTWGMSTALLVFATGVIVACGLAAVLLLRTQAAEQTEAPLAARWFRHRGCTACPLSELEHTCPSQGRATDIAAG